MNLWDTHALIFGMDGAPELPEKRGQPPNRAETPFRASPCGKWPC